jgi:hypothetical protein
MKKRAILTIAAFTVPFLLFSGFIHSAIPASERAALIAGNRRKLVWGHSFRGQGNTALVGRKPGTVRANVAMFRLNGAGEAFR